MEILWLNIDETFGSTSLASSLNVDGKYQICDLSFANSYQKETNSEISYFTYCEIILKKMISSMKESKKDLLVINFTPGNLCTFEWLYLMSILMTYDPIVIGLENVISKYYNVTTRRFVQFDPHKNFLVDLRNGLEKVKKEQPRSDIPEVISIFNAHGTFLSFGSKFETIIKLKENVGLPISYEDFIQALVVEKSNVEKYPTRQTFYKNISKIAFVREHNPVDLFIEKTSRKRKH